MEDKVKRPILKTALLFLGFVSISIMGCYSILPSDGGGETEFSPPRIVDAGDVAVPAGYTIEVVATGLTFPTGVAFDDAGGVYVTESGYSYGEVWTQPRLLKVNNDGTVREIARGGRNGPWNGVTYTNGHFYIAEGGQLEGGRILRVDQNGNIVPLIENLPSMGDHHTNGPVFGADGKIYFGQGTATNAGVVGMDNAQFGWLKRFPEFHDIPCKDITLAGRNFETVNVLGNGESKVTTGAFSPFGTPTEAGQHINGGLPCNGAIMAIDPQGAGLELIAWGFRNPFGLAFAPDGRLYVTDNAYDDRGSRPVWGTGDYLWRVARGRWHGWPEFSAGKPLDSGRFKPPGELNPTRLLEKAPGDPPEPAAILGVHASANGLDFSRSADFGHVGEAFIAEFGDQSPDTGKSLHPVGFRVVRVNTESGHVEDFAVNESTEYGPASKIGTAGLERPVAVRFDRSGNSLYVVDFGIMLVTEAGPVPQKETGVLWKISR
jgi:glucose/arabinose dehydrogenase